MPFASSSAACSKQTFGFGGAREVLNVWSQEILTRSRDVCVQANARSTSRQHRNGGSTILRQQVFGRNRIGSFE